jgi:molybdenum-dependent DNA-binding transcriptional regulator ModE
MTKRDPSPRQQQIAEAVAEHGSVDAAAAALGISVLYVDRALSGYHRRVCGRRIAELEAEVARLRDKVDMDRAARRLERVVGRIERAVKPVSHRRVADGGTHVSQQRRHARATAVAAGTRDEHQCPAHPGASG